MLDSVFVQESALDLTELEDALVLVKQKKQKTQAPPDFLQQVDSELDKGVMHTNVSVSVFYLYICGHDCEDVGWT